MEYAKDKNMNLEQPENFTNISGRGIQAKLNGHVYLAGNKRLLEEKNIRINQNVVADLDAYASFRSNTIDFCGRSKCDWFELVWQIQCAAQVRLH